MENEAGHPPTPRVDPTTTAEAVITMDDTGADDPLVRGAFNKHHLPPVVAAEGENQVHFFS